jgi:hypothetical protein
MRNKGIYEKEYYKNKMTKVRIMWIMACGKH